MDSKEYKARLQKEALHVATIQGHKMQPFYNLGGFTSKSVCSICGKDAYVNTHPLPNDIDIGGEAVTMSCKG